MAPELFEFSKEVWLVLAAIADELPQLLVLVRRLKSRWTSLNRQRTALRFMVVIGSVDCSNVARQRVLRENQCLVLIIRVNDLVEDLVYARRSNDILEIGTRNHPT